MLGCAELEAPKSRILLSVGLHSALNGEPQMASNPPKSQGGSMNGKAAQEAGSYWTSASAK